MKPYAEMTKEELVALRKDLKAKYHDFQTKDLRLDMSRGKPSADQLDLSMGMMDVLSSDDDLTVKMVQTAVTTEYLPVLMKQKNFWQI